MKKRNYFDTVTPESILPKLPTRREICLPSCNVGELIQKIAVSNITTFTPAWAGDGDHAFNIKNYLKDMNQESLVASDQEKIGLYYIQDKIQIKTVIATAKLQQQFRTYSLAEACLIAHEIILNKKEHWGITWDDDTPHMTMTAVIFLKEEDYEGSSDESKGFCLILYIWGDRARFALKKVNGDLPAKEVHVVF